MVHRWPEDCTRCFFLRMGPFEGGQLTTFTKILAPCDCPCCVEEWGPEGRPVSERCMCEKCASFYDDPLEGIDPSS